MLKVSLAFPPLLSLAVTFTASVPTSLAVGVPEKVRVSAVKFSHDGSSRPSAFVAVNSSIVVRMKLNVSSGN